MPAGGVFRSCSIFSLHTPQTAALTVAALLLQLLRLCQTALVTIVRTDAGSGQTPAEPNQCIVGAAVYVTGAFLITQEFHTDIIS